MKDWHCELCGKKLEDRTSIFLTLDMKYKAIDVEICEKCASSFDKWFGSRKDIARAKE